MTYVTEKQIVAAWEEVTLLIGSEVDAGKNIQQACKLAVDYCNKAHQSVFDNVCEIVEKFSFNRRRYGGTTFTWALPPNANGFYFPSLDPWKGTRYPKAVLFVDVLQHLGTSTDAYTEALGEVEL